MALTSVAFLLGQMVDQGSGGGARCLVTKRKGRAYLVSASDESEMWDCSRDTGVGNMVPTH